jgi:hypothetical protein
MMITGGEAQEQGAIVSNVWGETKLPCSFDRAVELNLPEILTAQPETNLLNLLLAHAEAAAPQFSSTILANLVSSPTAPNPPEHDLELLTYELQHWFTSLFQPGIPTEPDRSNHKTRSQQNHLRLPLSFLLSNLEIILRFGREITLLSPQSELSMQAFIKSLSYKLANKQVDAEQRLEFVSSLMLLD